MRFYCTAALFNFKIEQLSVFDIAFQPVVDGHTSDSGRSSGENEVADFKREKAADVGNNFIERVDQIAAVSVLHGCSVDIETEIDVVYICQFFFRNKLAHGRRVIKCFGNFPGSDEAIEF